MATTNYNDENAIVNDKDNYNKKIQTVIAPEHGIGIDTAKKIIDNIIGAGEAGKLDISSLNSFTQVSQSRNQIYQILDTMAEDSTIAAILETYAEDATEYNDKGQIVWVEAQDSKIGKYITYLLDTIQVDKHIYKWIYSLCKYGDVYFRLYKASEIDNDIFFGKNANKQDTLNEDIKVQAYKTDDKFVNYIEMNPNPAELFELTRFGKTVGYIKADVRMDNTKKDNLTNSYYQYKFKKSDVEIFDGTMFTHASLEDNSSRSPEEVSLFLNQNDLDSNNGITYQVKRGQSLLYNTFKIWRELALLENSMLLNRITKSAIVRMINVEVGDMPKEQVGPHLQGVKALMEQKSAINTGESITEYTNPGPIENNIYVPTNNGKGAVTADQIGGDVNVGQLSDIDYFQNKFFGAMRIPKQYFGLTDDGAGFNGGQSLAIISSRYAKMIKRIQNAMIQALTDTINLLLLDRGLDSYINEFVIKMQPPTTQEEIDRRDNTASKIQIANDVINMLSDIEDPVTKLKITKILLSNIITDTDVIDLLDEEIDNMEQGLETNLNTTPTSEEGNELGSFGGASGSASSNEPLDLDAELGLETPDEEMNGDDDSLPTPEELGVDMTDNNFDDTPEDTGNTPD